MDQNNLFIFAVYGLADQCGGYKGRSHEIIVAQ